LSRSLAGGEKRFPISSGRVMLEKFNSDDIHECYRRAADARHTADAAIRSRHKVGFCSNL